MEKKEINKYVSDYVKFINANKKELGLTEDVVISTKLNIEELEKYCESVGEQISEALGGDMPDNFIQIYTILGEKLEEYKAGLRAPAAPVSATAAPVDPTPVATNTINAPVGNTETSGKKKRGPKKAAAPKQKDVAVVGVDADKDKAIKKLFDLLPSEAINDLDAGTMRTILSVQK